MAKKDKTKVRRVRSTEDKNLLISSLIYIVLGAMLCIFKTELLKYAMLVVGIIAIVIGVLAILKGDLIYGVVTAAIGALIILGGFLFLQIILLVIGYSRCERRYRAYRKPQIYKDKHNRPSFGYIYDSSRRSAYRFDLAVRGRFPYRYRRFNDSGRRIYVLWQETCLILKLTKNGL